MQLDAPVVPALAGARARPLDDGEGEEIAEARAVPVVLEAEEGAGLLEEGGVFRFGGDEGLCWMNFNVSPLLLAGSMLARGLGERLTLQQSHVRHYLATVTGHQLFLHDLQALRCFHFALHSYPFCLCLCAIYPPSRRYLGELTALEGGGESDCLDEGPS